jgi:uncharacterized OsmC-like protein
MNTVNELNVDELKTLVARIMENPHKGNAKYAVKTTWDGQFRAITRPEPFALGDDVLERSFEIATDEPPELCGSNHGPNPQELLFAALNSCMMITFVVHASLRGIRLESLEIRTAGTLDLRGFADPSTGVNAGFDQLNFDITVRGTGTQQEYEEILEATRNSSPNYFNLSRPIKLIGSVSKA